MNNQGGRTRQINGNADIRNEVNPHQSDRLSMPDLNLPYHEIKNSNIAPNNESNGALGLNIFYSSSPTESPQRFPDRLYGSSFLQYRGRSHSIAEFGMSLSPEDVRNNHDHNLNLSLSSSSHPSGSRGEGLDGSFSANNRVLPFKRRYSDLASGESLTGESSTRGTQLAIAQELAASSQANSDNNVNVSAFRNELANIPRSNDFEAAVGHNTMLVSNMQNQTPAATAPQGVIRANRLLNNYSRVQQVALPTQAPLFHQSGRYRFISSSRTTDGATSSVQPLEYASNLSEPRRAYAQNINIISSRNNAPPLVLPVHSEIISEVIAPLHNQRIIQGNLMPHPQYRRENRVNDPQNLHFGNGTTHLGNLLNHEPHGSSSRNVNPSNVPVLTLGNSRTANENRLVARYETQARGNVPPFITSVFLDSNWLLVEVRATAVQIREVAQRTTRVEQEIQNLRTMRNLPRRGQVAAVVQNQNANRLTAEEILKHIKRENFELVGDQTTESKEVCSICQEDYVNGEEIGRLDCAHTFHINCIKQWLVIKNLCPICKQIALTTDGMMLNDYCYLKL